MTEAEWNSSNDPQAMLAFVKGRGCTSDRKLRLYAVAWCREKCPELTHAAGPLGVSANVEACLADCSYALTVAERYADGLAKETERLDARSAVRRWHGVWNSDDLAMYYAVEVARACVANPPLSGALPPPPYADSVAESRKCTDSILQANWLRCLFGLLPFRQPTLGVVREWRDNVIAQVAQRIYERREFHLAPFLADMLQEAGCHDAEVLAHLRSPDQTHTRGCFALDLTLGRA